MILNKNVKDQEHFKKMYKVKKGHKHYEFKSNAYFISLSIDAKFWR
jgi:hypothetical protein